MGMVKADVSEERIVSIFRIENPPVLKNVHGAKGVTVKNNLKRRPGELW
jgi:hypothetical protein